MTMIRCLPHFRNISLYYNFRKLPEIKSCSVYQNVYRSYHSKLMSRPPCPPPPPDPCAPKPPSKKWIFAPVLAAILTAAFVVHAKKSPEIRDWLTIYAPWFDDFIAMVYEENLTYRDHLRDLIMATKRTIDWAFEEPDPDCVNEVQACPRNVSLKSNDHSYDVPNKNDCKKPCPPISQKDICELEACIKELGKDTVCAYSVAKNACADFNKKVTDVMENFTFEKAVALQDAMKERKQIVNNNLKEIEINKKKLNDLCRFLECGYGSPQDMIDTAKDVHAEVTNRIEQNRLYYIWEQDKTNACDVELKMVIELVQHVIRELEIIMPGLNYKSPSPSISTNADPDAFLIHGSKYIQNLRCTLDDAAPGMSAKVERSVNALLQDCKDWDKIKVTIDNDYKKRKCELDAAFVARENKLKADLDEKHRRTLQEQKDEYDKELEKLCAEKEAVAKAEFEDKLRKGINAERCVLKKINDEARAELRKFECIIEAQNKAEREQRRSKELWCAAYRLLIATKKGQNKVNVERELNAIQLAKGTEDDFVEKMLRYIPDSVKCDGLVPESVLRRKFHKMEKMAKNVALVDQDGGILPVYLLSWIQSTLLFYTSDSIPKEELVCDPVIPKNMDTFELLQRARYYIERGDIALAHRYVSELQGASRTAAESWLKAANGYLETKQVAETLITHATSIALQYI